MSKEDADVLLDAFCKDVGVAPQRLDQGGTALLAFGTDQELIFHYSDCATSLHIWSPLHRLTLSGNADNDAVLMQRLLTMNFPSETLDGAYFAIDAEVGVVLLGCAVALDMTAVPKLINDITSFAHCVINTTVLIEREGSEAKVSPPVIGGDDVPFIKA